jgi:signal peptidase II
MSQPGSEQGSLRLYLPLLLSLAVVILDQLTKLWIVNTIPYGTIGHAFGGDFLRIIHVQNTGAAFSLGADGSPLFRIVFVLLLPTALIGFLVYTLFRTNEWTPFQRWLIAGLIGGGLGNLIDRYFRPGGVVDFIDVKFYGLFGLERWPTFNVADSTLVVCALLLMASILFTGSGEKTT